LILNLEVEIKGAKSSGGATSYSKACKFDATADMEELQIKKSSESPNDRVRFRFDLQIRLILELQPNIPLKIKGFALQVHSSFDKCTVSTLDGALD